jgi:hypothetical protein
MPSYVSARGRAQLVEVLLAVQLALWSLRLGGWVVAALAPRSQLAGLLVRGAVLSSPIVVLLLVGSALAFLAWLARAASNLPALNGVPLSRWRVARSLVWPAQARRLLWRVWHDSDPTPPAARRARLLWYGTWLPLGAAVLLDAYAPHLSLRLEDDQWLLALQALCAVVAAGMGVPLVRDVQRRQDEQWLDRARRQLEPEPAADRLR